MCACIWGDVKRDEWWRGVCFDLLGREKKWEWRKSMEKNFWGKGNKLTGKYWDINDHALSCYTRICRNWRDSCNAHALPFESLLFSLPFHSNAWKAMHFFDSLATAVFSFELLCSFWIFGLLIAWMEFYFSVAVTCCRGWATTVDVL